MQMLGQYRASFESGALTGVAAGTSTAGHVFAFRWTDATKLAYIQSLRIRWLTTTAFTAAQEMTFRLFRATGYSASHSGGTAATLTGSAFKRATSYPTTVVGDIRIGNTGALTAGTHTLDSDAMATLEGFSQLGASPNLPFIDTQWTEDHDSPLILATNEGLVLRNEILMGAAGVGRLIVDLSWMEANP